MKRLIFLLAFILLTGSVDAADMTIACFNEGSVLQYWDSSYTANCTTDQDATAVTYGGLALANTSGGKTEWNLTYTPSQLTFDTAGYSCTAKMMNITVSATNDTGTYTATTVVSNVTYIPCKASTNTNITFTPTSSSTFTLGLTREMVDARVNPNLTLVKASSANDTLGGQIIFSDTGNGGLLVRVPLLAYNTTDAYSPYVMTLTDYKNLIVSQSVKAGEVAPYGWIPSGLTAGVIIFAFGAAVGAGGQYLRKPVK